MRLREKFPLRVQLWLARRKLQRYFNRVSVETRAAVTAKKPADEIDKIARDWQFDVDEANERIESLASRILFQQARKLDLPLPDRDLIPGFWHTGQIYGETNLNRAGRAALRTDILKFHAARRERWTWWAPILFGAIGSITALVLAFKK